MTNREHLTLLREHLNTLADQIETDGLSNEYVAYIDQLGRGHIEPEVVDLATWNLMLPAEKKLRLLAHYHTIRSEILAMSRDHELKKLSNLTNWLDSPWVRVPITLGGLVKAAELLYSVAKSTGLFLRAETGRRLGEPL